MNNIEKLIKKLCPNGVEMRELGKVCGIEKGSVMQMPQISNSDTDNFKIPIPPISEQQKIVEILDKFEELIRLLEREIDLREKQYEYYREKLLNFKIKFKYEHSIQN